MPLFLSVLGGLLEFSYDAYLRVQIEGNITKVTRDLTLESATIGSTMDQTIGRISTLVQDINDSAQVEGSVSSYRDYGLAGNPAERFVDSNGNGICDNGESFEDANGDGIYSSNSASTGLGGAEDVIVLNITVSYTRLFGFLSPLGLPREGSYSSQRMFRVQPYSTTQPTAVLTCP